MFPLPSRLLLALALALLASCALASPVQQRDWIDDLTSGAVNAWGDATSAAAAGYTDATAHAAGAFSTATSAAAGAASTAGSWVSNNTHTLGAAGGVVGLAPAKLATAVAACSAVAGAMLLM